MEKRSDTNNKTSTQSNARKYHLVFAFFLPLFAEPLFLLRFIRSPLCDIFISRQIFHATFARSIFYVLVLLLSTFFFHTFIHSLLFLSMPVAAECCSSLLTLFSAANAPLCACSLDAEHQTVQFSRRHNSLLTPFLLQHETFSRLPLNSGLECSCVPCA